MTVLCVCMYVCTYDISGQKRRLVFGRRGKTSFAVQRSEEVYPDFSGSRSGPVQLQPSSCSSDADPDAEDEERFPFLPDLTMAWPVERDNIIHAEYISRATHTSMCENGVA